MIDIKIDQAELQKLMANVQALEKKLKRKTLNKVGNEVGKLQLTEMKRIARSQVHSVTGALIKSLSRKVSVKAASNSVTSIVGPRKDRKTKAGVKRFAVMRGRGKKAVAVLNRQGEQLFRQPTRYAHLAGPKRRSRFVQDTVSQTKNRVREKMVEVLTEALSTVS